jgi:UDP-N-acetylmuramyl pentapeptide phosphotransferase/UDP-N-acetylglucosamine-1-phosphate transferase
MTSPLLQAQFFMGAAVLSVLILWLLMRSNLAAAFTDVPNERSLHAAPVPRIGGIALAATTAIALLISFALASGTASAGAPVRDVLLCALPLFVVSAIDDRHNLPAGQRILVHAAAAILLMLVLLWHVRLLWVQQSPGSTWMLTVIGALAMVLATIWSTNLFNFMDGADGLAGGMAAIGFGTYAIAAMHAPGGDSLATACAVISGAATGFLLFNFPPARVFLGDAGSVPLGFLAAALGILGSMAGHWPWWFGALVFSPFIADASLTLCKRILRGEKFWQAHRQHYYQRLILFGWSHRVTALAYYFLMLASALSALFAQKAGLGRAILLSWVITYALLALLLEWRFHKNNKDKNHTGST